VNLAHTHLLLNHFPTIGTIIGLGLFLVSLVLKSNELKRASLVIFLGIALITLPTYVTGNAAQEILGASPDVSKDAIETHEGAALTAFLVMEIMGGLAWLGLWQYRRSSEFPRWIISIILVLALVTIGLMARAANIGGEIRHPEIRPQQATTTVEGPLARNLGAFVTGVTWVWPTCETAHFVGLCLLFGVAGLVDLRMLGFFKVVPFSALHRLLPWGVLAFGVNLLTGMLFFVAAPEQYAQNGAFEWKVALMLLAALNVLYFTIFDEPWAIQSNEDAPFSAKAVAATAILLVIGVIYCGRMLPFIGNAF
jgi:uncharacterized membrane protein